MSLNLGYDFKAAGKNAEVHLGYEKVKHADNLGTGDVSIATLGAAGFQSSPENNTNVGASINVDKHALVGFEYVRTKYFSDALETQAQYLIQAKVTF